MGDRRDEVLKRSRRPAEAADLRLSSRRPCTPLHASLSLSRQYSTVLDDGCRPPSGMSLFLPVHRLANHDAERAAASRHGVDASPCRV